MMKQIVQYLISGVLIVFSVGGVPSYASELPTYTIVMADGKLSPSRLVVPAHTRFKIILQNKGQTAAEFESVRLRKEKALAPGMESFIVIKSLSPGEYAFFDDFHQVTGQGVIIAH